MDLTRGSDGTTILDGPVADQAALPGLLHKVRDLGLPLISVTQAGPRPFPAAEQSIKETDMATTVQAPATNTASRVPMTSTRKTALVAGIFYLITFVSIPTVALYGPVKHRPGLDPVLRHQPGRARLSPAIEWSGEPREPSPILITRTESPTRQNDHSVRTPTIRPLTLHVTGRAVRPGVWRGVWGGSGSAVLTRQPVGMFFWWRHS